MTNSDLTVEQTEIVAAAMHAAWYAYAVLAMGEPGEPWATAPVWQKDSCRNAAQFHFRMFTDGVPVADWPRRSHENWMALRTSQGWVYGPVKDVETKQSPCMVAYDELDEDQRRKDNVAVEATLAMFAALGLS